MKTNWLSYLRSQGKELDQILKNWREKIARIDFVLEAEPLFMMFSIKLPKSWKQAASF